MKKRVLLVVAAMSLLVAVGLTGCGGTTVADPNAASSAAAPTASMALSEVSEDNLNGMITYLKGNGVIKEATTDMKAEMIGAVSGKMVQAIYGDSVALVEIYEFDKDNSYVRCAIWGKKASRFFYEVNEEKDIFIEGSGLNKQLRNINGLNNYVFTVNCENYQILT